MDAVPYYIEDALLRDEPLSNPSVKEDEYKWPDFNHIYTFNLWEGYELLHELRLFVDEINEKKGGAERCMYTRSMCFKFLFYNCYGI